MYCAASVTRVTHCKVVAEEALPSPSAALGGAGVVVGEVVDVVTAGVVDVVTTGVVGREELDFLADLLVFVLDAR